MSIRAAVFHTAVVVLPGQSFSTATWTPFALAAVACLSAVAAAAEEREDKLYFARQLQNAVPGPEDPGVKGRGERTPQRRPRPCPADAAQRAPVSRRGVRRVDGRRRRERRRAASEHRLGVHLRRPAPCGEAGRRVRPG